MRVVSILCFALLAAYPLQAQSRIAFASERDGNVDIYAIDADGSGLTRLTNDPNADFYPAWSPDGTRVAFRRGLDHIMVMNADGSGVTLLAPLHGDNPEFDLTPEWSPDGSRVLFDTYTEDGRDIFVVGADGSELANLTDDVSNPSLSDETRPRWSPDGSVILFESGQSPERGLYRMSSDGTNVMRLSDGMMGTWSPDGSRIAFVAVGKEAMGEDLPEWDIVVMKADGSDRRTLTSAVLASLPTWSPDGSKIAFRSFVGEGIGLYVMHADGSNRVKVFGNLLLDFENAQPPSWSPDGGRLAFTTNLYDIYVVDADGANARVLAPHSAGDADPVWSPAPH